MVRHSLAGVCRGQLYTIRFQCSTMATINTNTIIILVLCFHSVFSELMQTNHSIHLRNDDKRSSVKNWFSSLISSSSTKTKSSNSANVNNQPIGQGLRQYFIPNPMPHHHLMYSPFTHLAYAAHSPHPFIYPYGSRTAMSVPVPVSFAPMASQPSSIYATKNTYGFLYRQPIHSPSNLFHSNLYFPGISASDGQIPGIGKIAYPIPMPIIPYSKRKPG